MAKIERYQTPIFRISFPSLFKPDSYNDSKPKFSVQAIWEPKKFSEKEKKLWKTILFAMDKKCKEAFNFRYKELPDNYGKGLRDGIEKKELEGYGEGKKFATLSSLMRPGVVNRDMEKIGPENDNENEIYPGCYARATISIYTYNNRSKGISLGLMNLQKVKEGERLDSRTDASEDFDDDFLDDENLLEEDDGDDPFDDDIPF